MAGTRVPVLPCHLEGPFEAAPPSRLFPRFRRISLVIGAPQEFSSVENTPRGGEQVAGDVELAVRRLGDLSRRHSREWTLAPGDGP